MEVKYSDSNCPWFKGVYSANVHLQEDSPAVRHLVLCDLPPFTIFQAERFSFIDL